MINEYIFLDCCNLYGYAMSQKLPQSGLRWLTPDELQRIDIRRYNESYDFGIILEVNNPVEFLKL